VGHLALEQKAVLDNAVANYTTALNALSEDQFLACFRSNCVVRDPFGVSLYEGEDGLRLYFHTMQSTWAEFQITPVKLFYGGRERVVFAWEAIATAHNGKQVRFDGINVLTLEGTLIDGLESYWDAPAMFEQIKD
jgi:hypothetical protein